MSGAVEALARAFDPADPPAADPLSQRILDAALALTAASGLRAVTMDDVARRAGVGRMTVYRRFAAREGLLDALMAREAQRCLAELDAAASPADPIADQVAEGFVTSIRLIREHPVLSRFARSEPESALEALNEHGGALFLLMRGFIAGRLRAAQEAGTLGAAPVEEAAELLARLCASFVLIAPTALPLDDPDRLRDLARRLVAPMLSP